MPTAREQLEKLKRKLPNEGYALTITPTQQLIAVLGIIEAQQEEIDVLKRFRDEALQPHPSDPGGE